MLRAVVLVVTITVPALARAADTFFTILPTDSQPPEVVRIVERSQTQMDLDFRSDSVKTLEEAVALHRKLAGKDAPELISTLETLADAQSRSEQPQQAVKTCEEMVRLASMHFPPGDYRTRSATHSLRMAKRVCELPQVDYRDLVTARDRFGETLTSKPQPNPADAIKVVTETMNVFRRNLGPTCWECIAMRSYLCAQFESQRQFEEVIAMTQLDADAIRQEFGEDHPFYGQVLSTLCVACRVLHRHDEAIDYGLKASEIFNSNHLTARVRSSLLHEFLVASCVAQNRLSEAEVAATKHLQSVEFTCPPGSLDEANAVKCLATVAVAKNEDQKAIAHLTRALEIRRKHPEGKAEHLAVIETSLAALYLRNGQFADAEPLLVHALTIYKNLDQKQKSVSRRRIITAHQLAEAYLGQSNFHQAIPLLQFVCRNYSSMVGSPPSERQEANKQLVSALRSVGRNGEADEVLKGPRPFIAD